MWAARQRYGVVSAYESPDPPCPARRRIRHQQLWVHTRQNSRKSRNYLNSRILEILELWLRTRQKILERHKNDSEDYFLKLEHSKIL